MANHIHKTITGTIYEVKAKGGRNKLPAERRLSKAVKGMVTESMRAEIDQWIANGYKETVILNFALRMWLDSQKSVQNTL